MTTVLKLGGSVVTHKDRPETVDEDALATAADAIADALAIDAPASDAIADALAIDAPADTDTHGGALDRLVLVHGGGSFGHHHADRHGVSTTTGTHDARALVDIHDAMGRLNDAVLDTLQDRAVPALPVRPLSVGARRTGDGSDDEEPTLDLPTASVETMLDEGFVPVMHGDVVAHEGNGGTILSGDAVVVSLAQSLGADRVGLCSTVPGVLDANGTVVDRIDSLADAADTLGDSNATDVTGGMAGKVRTLLGVSTPAHVFGLADLPPFFAGETPGTLVGGEPRDEHK